MRARFLPALVCLLAAAPALPQTVIRGVSQRREDWRSLAKVKREASFRGLLVVLEEGTGPVGPALRKVLAADDRLFEANLPVIDLGAGTCAPQLRLQEGWSEAPRWALLDRQGRAVASGTEAPSAEALWKAFEASGLPTWAALLESFLRQHPDQGEARYHQLALHNRVASRRMRALLTTPAPTPEVPHPSPTLKTPLSGDEDVRIWGDAARALERLLSDEAWMGGDAMQAGRLVHPLAVHSPLMQDVARKALPDVETVLRNHPSHDQVWSLWLGLAETAGALDRLGALVEELAPTPGALRFPPEQVTAQLVERLRRKGDWAGMVKVLEPAWTHWLATAFQVSGDEAMRAKAAATPWEEGAAPLVEACLRSGNLTRADAVVKEAVAWSASPRYPELAAALAKRLEQPALAERWARLTVPAPKAQTSTRGGSLEDLARDAWHKPFWVLLEDGTGKADAAFQRAVRDEALGDFLLEVKTVSPKTQGELARSLAGRLGKPTGWLLVGDKGKVLGGGAGTPEPGTLRETLEAAQVRPLVRTLEAFVKAHPGHANALQVLLGQHLMLAERRMRPHLKPQEKDRDWHDREPLELQAPLTEAEDARIWGPSAALLQRLFQEEAFRLRGLDGLHQLPPDAPTPPACRRRPVRCCPSWKAGWPRNATTGSTGACGPP